MPLAEFLCLCIDSQQPSVLGPWWAEVLGLAWQVSGDDSPDDGRVVGPTKQHSILFMPVDEPKSVKHRVHLDIYCRALADLEAIGANQVETHERWTIMADPEGGEFCAFLRDDLPADRLHGLAVDCVDPGAMAAWWAEVYGADLVQNDGWSTVENVPGMPILTMDFCAVPEPKTAKNRIHWDVTAADVDALITAGASLLRAPDGDIDWHVLADPEGNEFCVFSPQ